MNTSTAPRTEQSNEASQLRIPFALTAPAAEAWLQKLAALGFGDACRQLFHVLRTLNRLDIGAHQRFQLLETLRPHVLEFSRRFAPYFVEQQFPLDDKISRIVRLATQFQAELALGYHRVADSPGCTDAFNKTQQATVIHRALTAYGLYFLRTAQCYEVPAPTVLTRIYELYRRAETLGATDTPVTDRDCPHSASATASECLRKISLFQLALPTRLQQAEIGKLYGWLDDNAHLAALQQERAANLNEAHFYLDLASNAPPQPIGALESPNTNTRYLFLDPLLLKLLASSSVCAAFGPAVVRRLTPGQEGWRHGQNFAVVFATGAEGCAALFESDVGAVKRRLSGHVKPVLELSPQRIEERTPLATRVAKGMTSSKPMPAQVSRDEIWGSSDPDAVAATHSSQGLLRFTDEDNRAALIGDRHRLRMGQLVAIATEDTQPALGVVRAITPTPDSSRVWADLELLTGDVATARAYVEGEKRRRLHCVVLTGDYCQGSATSIMLLPTPFPNGTWITLEQNGTWSNQRLARLIETTGEFSQYHLVPAE